MTRLTKSLRDIIEMNADERAFGEQRRVLIEREIRLAMKVYNLHYPLALQEIMTTMQTKMGGRPFKLKTRIYTQRFGGRAADLVFDSPMPFFYEDLDEKYQYLDVDHPLTLEFNSISNDWNNLKTESIRLRSEVRAVLDSVTTVKRLLEVWPEVKDLLPELKKPTVNLPVVQIDRINAEIFHKESAP